MVPATKTSKWKSFSRGETQKWSTRGNTVDNIVHSIMHNTMHNTVINTTHHHPYQTKQSTVDRPSFLRLDHRGDGVLKVEDDLIGVERQDVAPRKRLNVISP